MSELKSFLCLSVEGKSMYSYPFGSGLFPGCCIDCSVHLFFTRWRTMREWGLSPFLLPFSYSGCCSTFKLNKGQQELGALFRHSTWHFVHNTAYSLWKAVKQLPVGLAGRMCSQWRILQHFMLGIFTEWVEVVHKNTICYCNPLI